MQVPVGAGNGTSVNAFQKKKSGRVSPPLPLLPTDPSLG
jgi:hypothetical protein